MAVLRGGVLIVNEEATGLVNGINKVFTTGSIFAASSLEVHLNGLVLLEGNDYTILTSQSFEFTNAPTGGADPDVITVSYQRL